MRSTIVAASQHLAGYWAFFIYAATHMRVLTIAPVRNIFQRQLYFTGVEGLRLVALLGSLAGALVATQTTEIVGGNSQLTVRVLVWTIVDELGPLLAAIIIIARSAVAVATELAVMETRSETDHIAALGIPILDYLVVPRIAALTLSVITLAVYFVTAAVAGGLAVSALFQNVSFATQLRSFFEILTLGDVSYSLLKSFCFGAAISSISCYHGLAVRKSVTAIPIAARRAVIQSLLFAFALDVVFACVRYLA